MDFLIEKGAKVNLQDKNRETPLHLATENGHKDAVDILIKNSAKINLQNKYGDTALHLAARNGYEGVVDTLINNGAEVNLQNKNGRETPLHLAARNGYKGIVDTLIEKGAKVNLQNKDGETSLHMAARNGYKGIVNALIRKGAEVNLQNKDGETPLHLAIRRDHQDVVDTLIKKGAKVDLQGMYVYVFLHEATESNVEMAKSLIAHAIKLNDSKLEKPWFIIKHTKMSEYWDKCLDEVTKMKEEEVGGDITFYDIFVSQDANKLVSYIRNKQVVKALETSDYRNKFPTYANDIDYLLKTVKQRIEALNTGEIIIKHFGSLSKNGPFNLKIAEYLSNDDLRNLRKVAIQTMDEEDVSQSLGNDVRVEPAAKKQGR